ncbi:MAG: hypothetical protein H7308_18340 [Chthonomonadaceae bacterium]|nr:hypothetical protein [Chthonomonadaceae bacterium]
MSDDKMPDSGMKPGTGKMGGMGMGMMGDMDKMGAGMSPMDKSEMKTMMDKIMAMPRAARKKALQKASGMNNPTDPAKMPDPGGKPMSAGGMGGDM